jgi:hypothetical protein
MTIKRAYGVPVNTGVATSTFTELKSEFTSVKPEERVFGFEVRARISPDSMIDYTQNPPKQAGPPKVGIAGKEFPLDALKLDVTAAFNDKGEFDFARSSIDGCFTGRSDQTIARINFKFQPASSLGGEKPSSFSWNNAETWELDGRNPRVIQPERLDAEVGGLMQNQAALMGIVGETAKLGVINVFLNPAYSRQPEVAGALETAMNLKGDNARRAFEDRVSESFANQMWRHVQKIGADERRRREMHERLPQAMK